MTTALALFSGGLDSILACRVIMAQGITVKAVKFVTPFFGYELLAREPDYQQKIRNSTGIDVCLRDISAEYLRMLAAPIHGYGKNFNPCLDCKILMASTILQMIPEMQADFIISGEVLGQRPMSQRRDAMRIVERDSGCDGMLLRPLSARNLPPTKMELDERVDRRRLLDISGRGRSPQIELAAHFGITEYPAPAGGCILTDVNRSGRIRRYYQENPSPQIADLLFLQAGRQFSLPNGGMLAMGRDEKENDRILGQLTTGDQLVKPADRPGPTGLLRYGDKDLAIAASLIARYSKNGSNESAIPVNIATAGQVSTITVRPAAEEDVNLWMR